MSRNFLIVFAMIASAGQAQLRLTVAVNNRAGLDSEMVRGAEEIASAVFRYAGVDLMWQECSNSEARPADFRLTLVT